MEKKITIAGFGGQGVMVIGQLSGYASCAAGKNALFLPKYGPEQRGGTASCTVTIADSEIGAPLSKQVDALIAVNQPSLDKFVDTVKPGGLILINSSMCNSDIKRKDVRLCAIDADNIAYKIGSPKVANIVVIGAYIKEVGILTEEEMWGLIKLKLGKKVEFLEMNKQAFKAGMEQVVAIS